MLPPFIFAQNLLEKMIHKKGFMQSDGARYEFARRNSPIGTPDD